MSDKKTKNALLEMLAEAVRNTQPRQTEPVRNPQPGRKRKTQSRKASLPPQRTPKTKKRQVSDSRKRRR